MLKQIDFENLPVKEMGGGDTLFQGLLYDEASGQLCARLESFVYDPTINYRESVDITIDRENAEDEEIIEDLNQTDRLIGLITGLGCKLFHDELGNALISIDGTGANVFKIRSKDFKSWLANLWWKKYKKGVSQPIIDTAVITLEGMALHEGEKIVMHTRIASLNGDWFYDLGDGRAVKITESGWEVLTEPPIIFYRYSHQRPQVEPIRGGRVEDMFDAMLHPDDQNEKLLLQLWLLAAFMPDMYHPILLVHGEQGSRKTTLFKMLRSLIDPSVLETINVRKDIAEFIQQASHHYFLPIDNLSQIKPDLSDLLCRLVTGEGFSKRELFTNDSDIIYSFQRVIGLNGINLVADKPDLLDRSLIIKLTPPGSYIDEREVFEKLNLARPKILGMIFDLMVKTKQELPNIMDTPELAAYRMAGFAKQSLAIGRALGCTDQQVFNALQYNRDMQHGHVMESSLLLQQVVTFMQDKTEWEGTANELADELKKLTGNDGGDVKSVPSANWIKRRIAEIIPTLRAQQINFVEKRGSRRLIGFTNGVLKQEVLQETAYSFEEIAAGIPFDDTGLVSSDGNDTKLLTSNKDVL